MQFLIKAPKTVERDGMRVVFRHGRELIRIRAKNVPMAKLLVRRFEFWTALMEDAPLARHVNHVIREADAAIWAARRRKYRSCYGGK